MKDMKPKEPVELITIKTMAAPKPLTAAAAGSSVTGMSFHHNPLCVELAAETATPAAPSEAAPPPPYEYSED